MSTPASRPLAELDAPFEEVPELAIGTELILENEGPPPIPPEARANEHVDFGAISNSIAPAQAATSISPPPAAIRSTPGARRTPEFARPAAIAAALCALFVTGGVFWLSSRASTATAPRAIAKNTATVRLAAVGAEVNTSIDSVAHSAAETAKALESVKVQNAAAALTGGSVTARVPVKPATVAPAPQPRVIGRFDSTTPVTPAVTPVAPAEPAPAANLPETPSRDDVQKALLSARPTLMACAKGRQGKAEITYSIGSSGRVRTATVGGDFAGSPEGSCMARAARTTVFPAFTKESLTVTFPYQL